MRQYPISGFWHPKTHFHKSSRYIGSSVRCYKYAIRGGFGGSLFGASGICPLGEVATCGGKISEADPAGAGAKPVECKGAPATAGAWCLSEDTG